MATITSAQFLFGMSLGIGSWLFIYAANRAWLGFWSFLR